MTATPPDVGFDDSTWMMRALPDGKVIAVGDWRTAGVLEPVLLDPAGGAPKPLLPPLTAGLSVRFVPD